jgi:peptidase T
MKAYERMLKYVEFDTASDETTGTWPSTQKQLKLAEYLVDELRSLGVENAEMDESGYVYGTLPANTDKQNVPAIGLIAHMDVVGDLGADRIKPQIVKNYGGDVIHLNGIDLDPATDKFLKNRIGHDLITTDGTTLLGGDDKAGIAEIMTALEYMKDHPEFRHGTVQIGFTPDEEIGLSPERFDVERFGADFGYTLDGENMGGIEYQNFNAVSAKVHIKGLDIHPGSAKDTMINAIEVAREFDEKIPQNERPVDTEGFEGFYHVMEISGIVSECEMSIILRDHDWSKIEEKQEIIKKITAELNDKYGEGTVTTDLKLQYKNMEEMIKPHMHVIDNARKAIKDAGAVPETLPIRGGTDGATLSFRGLPCPNLGTGSFNHHSVSEYADIQDMDTAVQIALNILKEYEENPIH